MSHLPVRVYSPEPLLGHPAKLIGTIARDIWAGRELAWRLFVRDLSAQYRQTFLGYIWAFLPPLVASMTFIFLNSQGIVQITGTAQPLTLLPAFWIVTVCAAIATFLGLVLFRLAMPHLIARMGG